MRNEGFSGEEMDLHVREVKARRQIIYESSINPPKHTEVKQAWEEMSVSLSSFSSITSCTMQKKWYNDVRRREKQKLATHWKHQAVTGGGSPKPTEDLTSTEGIAASTSLLRALGDLGLCDNQCDCVCLKGTNRAFCLTEPGGAGDDGARREGEKNTEVKKSRPSWWNVIRPKGHPFLEMQLAGFNML